MRTLVRPALLPIFVFASAACGPENPQPVAPPPPPPPSAVATAEPQADLSPVAEPPNLVAMMHWKSALADVNNLASCANVPPEIAKAISAEPSQEIMKEELRGVADTKALASLVVLDAPIDFAATLDDKGGKPHHAYAIGLSSLDAAKAAIDSVSPAVEVHPGLWTMKSGHCLLAASAGPTPARLVCGRHEEDAELLAPYLTRTAPTLQPNGGDLHGELRFAPIVAKYGAEARGTLQSLPTLAETTISLGEPTFDRAVVEAASGLRDEGLALLNDADKLTFDVSVDPGTCLRSRLGFELKGTSSWLAGSLADSASRQGPAPAIFWRLPKDADAAFYSHGGDPKRLDPIMKVLREMADGALDKAGIAAADRKAVVDFLSTSMSGVASVSASGHVDVAPPSPKAKPQERTDAMLASTVGWHLIGLDEPSDSVAKTLKDLVALANRKGLIDPLKKALDKEAKYIPTVKTVPAPAQLGKGALDVVFKVANLPDVFGSMPSAQAGASLTKGGKTAAKGDTVAFEIHVLLMADGNRTWLAIGTSRDALVKRLLAAKSGAPDDGTLAARASLEPLRRDTTASGGFLTMTQFTHAFATGLNNAKRGSAASDAALEKIKNIIAGLPHKGESPMFILTRTAGAPAPKLALSFDVGKGTLEDVSALVLGLRAAMP